MTDMTFTSINHIAAAHSDGMDCKASLTTTTATTSLYSTNVAATTTTATTTTATTTAATITEATTTTTATTTAATTTAATTTAVTTYASSSNIFTIARDFSQVSLSPVTLSRLGRDFFSNRPVQLL